MSEKHKALVQSLSVQIDANTVANSHFKLRCPLCSCTHCSLVDVKTCSSIDGAVKTTIMQPFKHRLGVIDAKAKTELKADYVILSFRCGCSEHLWNQVLACVPDGTLSWKTITCSPELPGHKMFESQKKLLDATLVTAMPDCAPAKRPCRKKKSNDGSTGKD